MCTQGAAWRPWAMLCNAFGVKIGSGMMHREDVYPTMCTQGREATLACRGARSKLDAAFAIKVCSPKGKHNEAQGRESTLGCRGACVVLSNAFIVKISSPQRKHSKAQGRIPGTPYTIISAGKLWCSRNPADARRDNRLVAASLLGLNVSSDRQSAGPVVVAFQPMVFVPHAFLVCCAVVISASSYCLPSPSRWVGPADKVVPPGHNYGNPGHALHC